MICFGSDKRCEMCLNVHILDVVVVADVEVVVDVDLVVVDAVITE